eukprot:4219122-Karenia_brevis.AAC.1
MEERSGGLPELPPSPIGSPRALGPLGPASTESSFLILPGKRNSRGTEDPGPSGPQNPINLVAEPSRSDEDIAEIVSMVVQGLLPQLQRP